MKRIDKKAILIISCLLVLVIGISLLYFIVGNSNNESKVGFIYMDYLDKTNNVIINEEKKFNLVGKYYNDIKYQIVLIPNDITINYNNLEIILKNNNIIVYDKSLVNLEAYDNKYILDQGILKGLLDLKGNATMNTLTNKYELTLIDKNNNYQNIDFKLDLVIVNDVKE